MSDKESCSTTNNECCGACGFSCPITGLNFNKKFLQGSLLMIVWMNFFSFIWHGKVLQARYMETASLWRTPEDMKAWAITVGISLSAIFATHIFYKGYEGKGLYEGIKFGIVMALLFSGMLFITYATQPMPEDILKMWFLGDLISYSFGAIFLTFLFGKK